MERTDSEIQQAVLSELKWDTHVDATSVGVTVLSGVVTLTGMVDSWAARLAAQDAAHRVSGVLDVANDLQVRVAGSPPRTDPEIARAVRHALEWDVFVPDTRIRSTVSSGWVTLEGDVDNWNERQDAGKAVAHLSGVTGITNKIDVKPPEVVPEDVRSSIERALQRRASREGAHVKLDVQDGRVTLSGKVYSWGEREAVVGAATGTPGVRKVEDHLRIAPTV